MSQPPDGAQTGIWITDQGVIRLLAGHREAVTWAELQQVHIMTTDAGPWDEDFFYVLVGPPGVGCVVPGGAPQAAELLSWLQRLPDFNNDQVIAASMSTEQAEFVCWRRADQLLN